jgi:tRNA (mo5U34)-methyltransferase
VQFRVLQKYLAYQNVQVLPLGIEDLPAKLHCFDTTFSMGVLYHRKSPIDHLLELRDTLRPGGELVLETLVVDGPDGYSLVPSGRYARMGNVWFLPSVLTLTNWLEKVRFKNVKVVDLSVTSIEEQRTTEWMTYHSLANFLDPEDCTKTVEGYPAPKRAVIVAEAPTN